MPKHLYYLVEKNEICKRMHNKQGVVMVEKILFPVLISFGIATILGPIVITFLRRLKVVQKDREEFE